MAASPRQTETYHRRYVFFFLVNILINFALCEKTGLSSHQQRHHQQQQQRQQQQLRVGDIETESSASTLVENKGGNASNDDNNNNKNNNYQHESGRQRRRGDTIDDQQMNDVNNDNKNDDKNDDNGYVFVSRSGKRTPVSTGSQTLGRKTDKGNNCSCLEEVRTLKRDLTSEVEEREALKKVLDTYITELYDLRTLFVTNKTESLPYTYTTPTTTTTTTSDQRSVSFSAKLSFNQELRPLEVLVFDTVLANNGHAYDPITGLFTAPVAGSYLFHATVLSGYNTKIETAITLNGKEVARMYSGAHDSHGSGSNMVVLNLEKGDQVSVRLLYQGGNHVHGYYSTLSGILLNRVDEK